VGGVLKGDDSYFQGIVGTVVVAVLERLCDFERQKQNYYTLIYYSLFICQWTLSSSRFCLRVSGMFDWVMSVLLQVSVCGLSMVSFQVPGQLPGAYPATHSPSQQD